MRWKSLFWKKCAYLIVFGFNNNSIKWTLQKMLNLIIKKNLKKKLHTKWFKLNIGPGE